MRFQTKPAAIPIMMYKVLQTGAKTQLGGLKLGFIKVGNQVNTLERVTIPDIYPIATQVKTKIRIFTYLFIMQFLSNLVKFIAILQMNYIYAD